MKPSLTHQSPPRTASRPGIAGLPARTAVLAALAFACGCAQHLDPTEIFTPPPPLAHGVNLTVYFGGDAGNTPVIHVWVNNAADNANVKTLYTTAGGGSYSCAGPNFCPCEGGLNYWPQFCAGLKGYNGNAAFTTDGNSSATQSHPFSMPLYFGWDWSTHDGSQVGAGSYVLHAEVSGYYYGSSPSEAQITVAKNGAAGSATGTVGGKWELITATWNP